MVFIPLACLVLLLSVARSEASKFEVTEGTIGDLKTMRITNTDTSKDCKMRLKKKTVCSYSKIAS